MNAHFLLVGYVFYWPVIGIDPSPRRLPHLARLGMVFASLPFHAFFGVILMSMTTVIGEQFYQRPRAAVGTRPARPTSGSAAASRGRPASCRCVIVLIALLMQWARADDREAKRQDRSADTEGDARPGGLQRDAAEDVRAVRSVPAATTTHRHFRFPHRHSRRRLSTIAPVVHSSRPPRPTPRPAPALWAKTAAPGAPRR